MFVQKKSGAEEIEKGRSTAPFEELLAGMSSKSKLLSLGLGVGFCFSGVFDVDGGRGHFVLNRDL